MFSKVVQFYNTKSFVEHEKIAKTYIKSYHKKKFLRRSPQIMICILKSIIDRKYSISNNVTEYIKSLS